MDRLITTNRDIQEAFDSTEFVEQTCRQIEKDLNGLLADEPCFVISLDDTPLEALSHQLKSILDQLISGSGHGLHQFIYRVDIPENEYLDSLGLDDEFDQLIFSIIRREAQKVFIRRNYR